MGYDVRYTQTRSFTEQEWAEVTASVEKLASAAKARIGDLVHPLVGRWGGTSARRPGISTIAGCIAFNGKRPAGCEDFELFRACSEYPQHFCIKTNRHPYDLLVKAALLAAHRIAPEAVPEIGADGGPEAWLDAMRLAERALGKIHALPIESESEPEAAVFRP
jgi:hypothetical protein